MATTQNGPARPFTDAEVNETLMAVIAWGGNVAAARRYLEGKDWERIPNMTTIHGWLRRDHAQRYHEMRERFQDEQETQLAHDSRDVATQASEGARLAVEKAVKALEDNKDKDPARTAANLATVADKMMRGSLTLQGRPSKFTETRDVGAIIASLVGQGIVSQAHEPVQAQIEEGETDDGL